MVACGTKMSECSRLMAVHMVVFAVQVQDRGEHESFYGRGTLLFILLWDLSLVYFRSGKFSSSYIHEPSSWRRFRPIIIKCGSSGLTLQASSRSRSCVSQTYGMPKQFSCNFPRRSLNCLTPNDGCQICISCSTSQVHVIYLAVPVCHAGLLV